VNLANVGNSYH